MDKMNSFGQPTHMAEPPPAEDASLQDEAIDPPRERDLIWPLVLALRDLGGSAHRNDIQERVTVLLELAEEQTAIKIPSGKRTKLRDRLNWAGFKLKHHKVLTYPSPGYRQLTPLGRTITESELDALRRGTDPTGASTTSAGDLAAAVERFHRDTDYPTAEHEEQERLREEWHQKLLPENIASFGRHDLTAVVGNWTFGNELYVAPHDDIQGIGVMAWIQQLDDSAFAELIQNVQYLCWGDDELWVRYEALTDSDSSRKTNNFGAMAASKILAICHPKRFLPVGVSYGKGRDAMLQRLRLPRPQGANHAQQVVDANDRLRDHLEPYFDDDLLGMATFLYWLVNQETPKKTTTPPRGLSELAVELLVDVEFLKDIVELLEDKGQVILYGPPGTGKTFLARALAGVLAPDESCRALVQFHPSTSYEDFFEGYRPAGTDERGIRYELTPGPLASMAERASEDPDEQHVMVIDEINRGNLPRVLGELLFLLEYRDESVRTLYRPPDEPFSLPENLWFIGTMNTADRSIALVDAALRRRFHFVPFFPDSGPMQGLLGRWLEREGEPEWVGRLVDAVNAELTVHLDGSHLLLGPSHFMKNHGSTLDERRESLRRIWRYNIEPFIEDQFFGDPDRIEQYRFDAVMERHGPSPRTADADPSAAGATGGGSPDPAGDDADDGVARIEDTADGDAAPDGSRQTAE